MKVKLYASRNDRDPVHEFDITPRPAAKGETVIGDTPAEVYFVEATYKHYVFGYRIAGEDSYAYFETAPVSIRFDIGVR